MTPDVIHDEREVNKVSLETYFFNFKQDSFSYSVDKLIEDLEKEFKHSWDLYLQGKHIQNNRIQNWYFSHDLLREKLLSVAEMKVVYGFRNLEIDLKKLVKAAYNAETKELYKWEAISTFLKNKGILLSNIDGYNDMDQLREVNNIIKHSIDFKNSKTSITEFKNIEKIGHKELLAFYNRVSKSYTKFLIALADYIYKDIYEFEDSKLDNMALELALRMTKEQANLFIEKLQSKY